ncbi:hypothetical protein D5H75_11980 [Bailinhaonella thermotolerans]|uniref:DUF5709 domain-containing protein n=2 Tax=Bailinhaonella thermotolerans TaxID=1070861 RepID=A0A3A4B5N3_9ACTN|nr:hypothetical protein D5H75_11980 [Bailinhaonella thermotolerans]
MDVRGDSFADEEDPMTDDIEAPEADAVEQHQRLDPPDDLPGGYPRSVPFDVDPADAADQEREVRLDEDEYR